MVRYWKPDEQQWEEYNRHIWETLVSQHKEEWDKIKQSNEAREPDSPFTLALTWEEAQRREGLARYGHFCPSTPTKDTLRRCADQLLLGDNVADRWEPKRTGHHQQDSIPHTPSEGSGAQPQTPETDIYEEAQHERNVRPTLQQWIEAIRTAADTHLERIPVGKRTDYISKHTWEKNWTIRQTQGTATGRGRKGRN